VGQVRSRHFFDGSLRGRVGERPGRWGTNAEGSPRWRTPRILLLYQAFKDASGISEAEKPWKVRLLFAKEVATYIRERVWHSSQQLRERRDGRLAIRLGTSGRKELMRWILSSPHAQLAKPPGPLAARFARRPPRRASYALTHQQNSDFGGGGGGGAL
jgi:hypothetical protein